MLVTPEGFRSFFLLSIGAILGSWTRMYCTNMFGLILSAKYWATFVVNITASFFLGLLIALQSHSNLHFLNSSSPLYIFICVGFLGSLSTFSTFISDLLNAFIDKHWRRFLSLSFCSLFGGLMAAFAGLALGDV